jgi:anti-sigma regulatory factor (Ser/Thr protein kinase)
MNGSAGAYLPRAICGPARVGADSPGPAAGAALPGAAGICGTGDALVPPVPGLTDGSGWPLRSFLELGALPGAVPCARLHAKQLTREWGVPSDDIELLVSELVTNAIRASSSLRQPGPVRMWLLCDGRRLLVMVWDAAAQPPVRVEADQDAEGGRGLLLVDALSDQWNWYAVHELGAGKIVWALAAPPMTLAPRPEQRRRPGGQARPGTRTQ